jgi:inhibitor of cysteine peptidase
MRLYLISGTVTGDISSGIMMTLSGSASASVNTESGGKYSFLGLLNGTYQVKPSYSGCQFVPDSQTLTISNSSATEVNFTSTKLKYSVSGTIDGAVIKDVVLSLTGTETQTTKSTEDGTYTFIQVSSGNYTIKPSLEGYSFTPASRNITVYGQNVGAVNFTSAPNP